MNIIEAVEKLDKLMEQVERMLEQAKNAPPELQAEIMASANRLCKLAEELETEIERLEKLEGGR